MQDSDLRPAVEDLRVLVAGLKNAQELAKDVFVSQKDLQAELRAIRKDFADLNTQVKVDSNFYKWLTSTSVFVALVLGVFGYSQWHDIIVGLRTKVDQTSEYQSNLARGLALANAQPRSAIEPLEKCYDLTPTDHIVAANLLFSYQAAGDWIKANALTERVQRQIGIDKINDDDWFLSNLGLSLLYEGGNDPKKLEMAGTLFNRVAPKLKGDPDERSIWNNL